MCALVRDQPVALRWGERGDHRGRQHHAAAKAGHRESLRFTVLYHDRLSVIRAKGAAQ